METPSQKITGPVAMSALYHFYLKEILSAPMNIIFISQQGPLHKNLPVVVQ